MTCSPFTDPLYDQAFSPVVDPGSAFVSILSVPCFSKLVRTSTPTYITCINFNEETLVLILVMQVELSVQNYSLQSEKCLVII